MVKSEEPRDERAPDGDDLVERAREIEEHAAELEEAEHDVEDHERTRRSWLAHQPKAHWPPLEPAENERSEAGD